MPPRCLTQRIGWTARPSAKRETDLKILNGMVTPFTRDFGEDL